MAAIFKSKIKQENQSLKIIKLGKEVEDLEQDFEKK